MTDVNLARLHPRYWETEAKCFGKSVEEETEKDLVAFDIAHLSHTEFFYPPRVREIYHEYADVAKRYCYGPNGRTPCPVRRECLAWAIKTDEEHGIWGGLSHRERNALVRKAAKRAKVQVDPDNMQPAIDAALAEIALTEK